MSDLFDELSDDDQNSEADLIEALKVKFGDGTKIDETRLAKGKIESDRHIATLQRELAELRKTASSQQTIDEILTKIRESSASQAQNPLQQPNPAPVEQKPDTSPNVQEVVTGILTEREKTQRRAENTRLVEEAVSKAYGPDAQRELNKKAKELGLTLTELKEIAAERPQVFFRSIGLDHSTPPSPPRGAVAPRSTQNAPQGRVDGQRDKQYYERLKRENPSEYRSDKVRMQYYKDHMANPELFR